MANLYEIVNPSDAVLISCDDDMVAAVAVLLLGNGKFGLERLGDNGRQETVLPLLFFGGGEEWLAEKGIDLGPWVMEHTDALCAALESVFYGKPNEHRALEAALSGVTKQAAEQARRKYNDTKRSSMNNIDAACVELARWLRDSAAQVKVERERQEHADGR